MHVSTDLFCSASIILPDKAGRQINIGGWAEGQCFQCGRMHLTGVAESTYGIRFYTPDGQPGTNSTNDWEEDWKAVSLQVLSLVIHRSPLILVTTARTLVSKRCYASQWLHPGYWG